jgi:hypothetical protein
MKKIIVLVFLLTLSLGYFLITPQKNIVTAAACGETCYSSSECPSSCPYCRTEKVNLYADQYLDPCLTGYCKCFEENFKSTKEGGSEQIVGYTEEEEKPIAPNEAICPEGANKNKCVECVSAGNSWTALGCLHASNPQSFVGQILSIVFLIAGGIAFLLIIFGGFQIILSGGNPDRVKAGKEMITAALGGLLLIIFSVFILRLIGYDILRLPGFNK